MSEANHISYSAADIERYHNKLMSAKEMHALEKAALDDPFLADALEGYSTVATDAKNDIAILREQLANRVTSESKVVTLKNTGFPWLRVAALIVVIAGAGLLAYQFVFTNKHNEVATSDVKSAEKESQLAKDTAVPEAKQETASNGMLGDSITTNTTTVTEEKEENTIANSKRKKKENIKTDIPHVTDLTSQVANPAPARLEDEAQYKVAQPGEKKLAEKNEEDLKSKQDNAGVLNETVQFRKKAFDKPSQNSNSGFIQSRPNVFRGQVMDAHNTPLPFANVTNTKDDVGTYTDVRGYFTLVSPDSSLNVQVRSVGFENTVSQLQNNGSSNAIVLQQDTINLPATVLSNKQFNNDRSKRSTLTVEEPEPYDGWYNYDTYLANNIEIPDERRRNIPSGTEVELSFDISKDGEPINIKVERSACKECETEAIRLLKEGPKWKQKKKNRRARLNVAF